MNRKIKFRAYCQLTNTIINDYCILDGTNFNGYDLTNNQHEIVAIMQFTGLKDKKGKEIFEGDSNGQYIVFFENGCFKLKTEKGTAGLLSNYINEFEVVGNIFENKEVNKNFSDYLNELNLRESGEMRKVFEHQVMTADGEKTCRVIVESVPELVIVGSEKNQNENDLKT